MNPDPHKERQEFGPVVGIVIIVVLLIIGGIYFLLMQEEQGDTEPVLEETRA